MNNTIYIKGQKFTLTPTVPGNSNKTENNKMTVQDYKNKKYGNKSLLNTDTDKVKSTPELKHEHNSKKYFTKLEVFLMLLIMLTVVPCMMVYQMKTQKTLIMKCKEKEVLTYNYEEN